MSKRKAVATTTTTTEVKEAAADTMTMTIKREATEEMTSTINLQVAVILAKTQRLSIKSKTKAVINPNLEEERVSDIMMAQNSLQSLINSNLKLVKREMTVAVTIVPSKEK